MVFMMLMMFMMLAMTVVTTMPMMAITMMPTMMTFAMIMLTHCIIVFIFYNFGIITLNIVIHKNSFKLNYFRKRIRMTWIKLFIRPHHRNKIFIFR